MHISLVTIGVTDLAVSTRYYEALGWERSAASVDGVITFLRGGTVVLGLFPRADLAEWGGYSGYVADPDGYLWEVAHAPGFELDQDGRIDLEPGD